MVYDKQLTHFSAGLNVPVDPVAYHHEFRFRLYLDNLGDAPGRLVQVNLKTLPDSMHNDFDFKGDGPPSGGWTKRIIDRSAIHTFHGGDDFVIYPKLDTEKNRLPWMTELGEFLLRCNVQPDQKIAGTEISLECFVQADNSKDLDETCTIRFIKG